MAASVLEVTASTWRAFGAHNGVVKRFFAA
jgi:hypothetical protein